MKYILQLWLIGMVINAGVQAYHTEIKDLTAISIIILSCALGIIIAIEKAAERIREKP